MSAKCSDQELGKFYTRKLIKPKFHKVALLRAFPSRIHTHISSSYTINTVIIKNKIKRQNYILFIRRSLEREFQEKLEYSKCGPCLQVEKSLGTAS